MKWLINVKAGQVRGAGGGGSVGWGAGGGGVGQGGKM